MRPIPHPDVDEVPLSAVLHALSDPVRLRIVQLAAQAPEGQPCGAFCAEIVVPKATLSHHFKVLREAGLIHQRGEGTQRLTTLRQADVERRFPGLLDIVLGAEEPL